MEILISNKHKPQKSRTPPLSKQRRHGGFVHLRPLGAASDPPLNLIRLRSNRLYTLGRNPRCCNIVLNDRRISRRHCQIFLDASDQKLRLVDGFFLSGTSNLSEIRRRFRPLCENPEPRCSLNGVFVNGQMIRRGIVVELSFGDEILFGCSIGSDCSCVIRYGFLVERIVFSKAAHQVFDSKSNIDTRATFLLSQCRRILNTTDPVSYLRSSLDLDYGKRSEEKSNSCEEKAGKDNDSSVHPMGNMEHDVCPEREVGAGCYSDGKNFFLNRLEFMASGKPDHQGGVTLLELLHPIESLSRVFIATFTCDIAWFLSCCELPNHLPITVACHNAERCWSPRLESRTSAPYSDYPNLLLVFPLFPEVIAFGKDHKKQGVACHHPKLIVLQREDTIRVVVTSANLVSKQWNHVTNTVWWQDFPLRSTPDYSALFGTLKDSKSDFAAQLAGFIATLITDVPSQAHWITELTKYDFGGAFGHLVASIPGLHAEGSRFCDSKRCLSAKEFLSSVPNDTKYLGSIQASVVGLSHRFCSTTDSNGAQLKTLVSILRKCQENTTGHLEVLLKRSINIPADANAVSVLVADLDEFSEGDCVQLGFLPRDVAKWVSPLNDVGFFSFSAFIYHKEALAAAFDGSNVKVQLLLNVSQGPKFSEMSRLIQPEHVTPLCSLLASLQRCLGLWRLQEVLSQYKWPESLETDFVYGSSSIGTSINAHFLASFSAAAGKRSFQFSESEESDPEWGCWNAHHEIKNPSMRILFPTIERVKNGAYGIQFSRRMLSFSEQTWQRLRGAGILHDAVPHPADRSGYPMHVKVACRRFQSKASGSSFGWIYCGSHNFSPAAWGNRISPSSEAKVPGASTATTDSGPRLHICNYELGIVLIAPPLDISKGTREKRFELDDIVLPFVVPAPKYQGNDRPATAQAMREALAALSVLQRDTSVSEVAAAEEMDEDAVGEELETLEASGYLAEEKEEERIYAEMLWSQVDSLES